MRRHPLAIGLLAALVAVVIVLVVFGGRIEHWLLRLHGVH